MSISYLVLLCDTVYTVYCVLHAGMVGQTTALPCPGVEWVYSIPAGIEFQKSEVTVCQYRACVDAGKCESPVGMDYNAKCNWGNEGRDNHPMNCINWYQATDFCSWIGGRLPALKEWLLEASNDSRRPHPWGKDAPDCNRAVINESSRGPGCGENSTLPVCSRPKGNSKSGICDMEGNVSEWTSTRPGFPSIVRIHAGGSWKTRAKENVASNIRASPYPEIRNDDIGFRCIREADASTTGATHPGNGY